MWRSSTFSSFRLHIVDMPGSDSINIWGRKYSGYLIGAYKLRYSTGYEGSSLNPFYAHHYSSKVYRRDGVYPVSFDIIENFRYE